jgi:hypothetical protein
MADRLCLTIINLLSQVKTFFQDFFDDILNYFNEKTEKNDIENGVNVNQTNTNSGVNSSASFFENSPSSKSVGINQGTTQKVVNSH